MDFADATLVLLAEALALRDILTLDRQGFVDLPYPPPPQPSPGSRGRQ